MKKFITLSALTYAMVFLFSCTKDSQSLQASKTSKQNSSAPASQDGRMVLPTPPHPDLFSGWIDITWEQITSPSGIGLHGHYDLRVPLTTDYNSDLKLVFMRIAPPDWDPAGGPYNYEYRLLPTDIMTTKSKVHIVSALQAGSLDLGIIPYNQSIMPDPYDFRNDQFRYFVVTRATYYANPGVDWSDYNSVVTALNTTP